MAQGKLIVLEGGEGAGKSTQLTYLHGWLQAHAMVQELQAQGHIQGILTTREPGGTPLGSHLRRLLLSSEQEAVVPTAELLLYAADRSQHVEVMMRPALEQGYWILCDRYIDSTVAYQGYGRGLNLALIEQLNQIATGGLVGDLTLWLQIDAQSGMARTRDRGVADRMERSEMAFHQRVQAGFAALADRYPERIVAVDASLEEMDVAKQVQQVIEQRLKQWYGQYLTT